MLLEGLYMYRAARRKNASGFISSIFLLPLMKIGLIYWLCSIPFSLPPLTVCLLHSSRPACMHGVTFKGGASLHGHTVHTLSRLFASWMTFAISTAQSFNRAISSSSSRASIRPLSFFSNCISIYTYLEYRDRARA